MTTLECYCNSAQELKLRMCSTHQAYIYCRAQCNMFHHAHLLSWGTGTSTNNFSSTTPIWYSIRFVWIHPCAVSPDLVNLWLDSMFISPLELSWEICWCSTTRQLVGVLLINIQVTQAWVEFECKSYIIVEDGADSLPAYMYMYTHKTIVVSTYQLLW